MDNQNQTQPQPQQVPEVAGSNKTFYLLVTLIVVIILGVIAVTFFTESRSMMLGQPQPAPTAFPTVPATTGSMTLASPSPKASIGGLYTVTVLADSAKNAVVGYDVLLSYDSTKFAYVSAKSASSDFLVSAANRAGIVAVTGAKLPSAKGDTLFNGNTIVTLTLRAKAAGATSLSILSQKDRETTKFVDSATKRLTPSVGSLSVTVY